MIASFQDGQITFARWRYADSLRRAAWHRWPDLHRLGPRERAADALGNLHIEPDTVVPALIRLLKDNSKAARYLAVSGLGRFQSQARPAVPAINALLTDPEEGVREAATNALRKIVPEALTNGF